MNVGTNIESNNEPNIEPNIEPTIEMGFDIIEINLVLYKRQIDF